MVPNRATHHIFWTGAYIYVRGQLELRKSIEEFQDSVDRVGTCGQSIVMNYNDFFEIPRSVSQAK